MNFNTCKTQLLLLITVAVFITSTIQAADRIDDFGLIDASGNFHQLSDYGYQKALVIVGQANGCEENYNQQHKYRLLQTTWESQGVGFLMLNATDARDAVAAEAELFDYDWPVMMDESQLVAELLGLTKAGEVVVLNPVRAEILYRGPLDTPPESMGQTPARHFIENALHTAISGDPRKVDTIKVPPAQTQGCAIEFAAQKKHTAKLPDYANEVAPILEQNCVACHRAGGIAPFAMDSHQMVQGWSPMIKETLLTKRMPPAQVDPAINHFSNARYISDNDLQTLVHWIDAGAPRGDSTLDPLAQLSFQEGWELGEPDHIVYSEDFFVPATGVIDYRYPVIDLNFEQDVWVKAIQFLPQERSVVHHMIARVVEPDYSRALEPQDRGEARFLEGYAPGKDAATVFPEGTGVFIPKGYKIALSSHYTTMGREVQDRTAIGLYFADEEPDHEFRTYSLSHGGPNIEIPAGAREHRMYASYVFDKEVMMHAFRPHMHTRGKHMRFKVIYPDNRSEVLLNVPNYNFAWQPTYRLTEPKLLPAGSRVVIDGAFDNSKYNAGVSDPNVTVQGGQQTWEEMFIGYFTYHYTQEI